MSGTRKHMRVIFPLLMIGLTTAAQCNTPMPFAGEMGALDQAFNALSVTNKQTLALRTLEAVAERQPQPEVVALATKAGLDAFAGRDLMFGDSTVRAYALDRIGASGLPEALQYLREFTRDKVGHDSSDTVYPAVQVALHHLLLGREASPQDQIAFLEKSILKPSVGQVANWAMNELCNRGSVGSLGVIRTFVHRLYPDRDGDDTIRFCEARAMTIIRDSNRAVALGTVLVLENFRNDEQTRLMRWAIGQLLEMHSADADRKLAQFAKGLGTAIDSSVTDDSKHAMWLIVEEIRRKRPTLTRNEGN